MNRDKEATKQRLLKAAGEILAEQGYGGLGVNAIARKAGVDKVLIYRYFKDLDGLLEAFVLERDFLSNLRDFFGEHPRFETKKEVLDLGKRILTGQLHQILKNRELQEILLWELHEKNRVTDAVAEARESQGVALVTEMAKVVDHATDIAAIASLLVGGIYYLALRSRTVDFYNGIDLRSDDGWKRVESAIEGLIDMIGRTG